MKAIILRSYDGPIGSNLSIEEIPLPPLKKGQVLVKMAAAPINPSDLVFLKNQYGVKKSLPTVPGFEGSGTVVDARGGLYARWLVGRRVACRSSDNGYGTWAEFLVVNASEVIPLLNSVTLEQGASLVVNPLTAWALLNIATRARHRAFVQTAAASALGLMIERLSQRWHLACINIVRRPEQVEILRKAGAVHVLNSSAGGFTDELHALCLKCGVRLAFDAVGGELTSRIAAAMLKGSKIIVYGALSAEDVRTSPFSLIFEDKRIEGFWLREWIQNVGFLRKLEMVTAVQKLLSSDLSTQVQARFPLEKFSDAITVYKERRSEGKVLLTP